MTNGQYSERDYLKSPSNPAPTSHQKPDGSFVVSVTWPEDEWVYGTILSYGEYIEVLEPEHIREIIKEKSQNSAKKYL